MENLILLFSCVLEFYIFIDFFHAFFPVQKTFENKLKSGTITLLLILCYFFINMLHLSYLNILSFLILLWLYSTFLFVTSLKERILYIIFICSIFFGCEFLFAILLNIPSYITGIHSITDLSSMPWQVFTLKLLTYVICNILKQVSPKSHVHFEAKLFLYYLCVPFASLGIMLLTYYSGIDFQAGAHTRTMLCIYFALMQFGNILIFYAFQRYSEELHHSMEQRMLITNQNLKLQHYIRMQELDDKHKELIHDTNHYIKTLGSLIKQNKNREALDLINELNIELESTATMIWTDHNIVNTILNEKKELADSKNISMDIYVEPGISFESIADMDLITILSNLLDNAIEACEKCDNEKKIQLRIYLQNQSSFCVLKVQNSFQGSLTAEDEYYASTKKDGGMHGIGLHSVSHTAEKYGGYLECFTEDQSFVAVAVFPHKNAPGT